MYDLFYIIFFVFVVFVDSRIIYFLQAQYCDPVKTKGDAARAFRNSFVKAGTFARW